MNLHRAAEAVGRIEAIDRVAEPLTKVVKRLAPPKSFSKDVLSGTWLGHPLHPLLTDIPIGSFTSATVIDLIGEKAGRKAADRLVDLGLLSALPTAAAGAADWSDTNGEDKRAGVVHAVANVIGLGCYAASAVARRRGRRGRATVLGLAGMSVMTVGGYLGGYLGFGRGIGVNNTYDQDLPTDWVDAEGAEVLVHETSAISSRCTHAGGPLQDGEIDRAGCTVTCPWHQSVFRLDTGDVVHGPATTPQPVLETRSVGGKVEVRVRPT